MARDGDTVAGGQRKAADPAADTEYRQPRSVQVRPTGDTVHLTAYVDRSSIEVFVGGQSLTSLVFPPAGPREARLAADGGVLLGAGTVTPLAGIR